MTEVKTPTATRSAPHTAIDGQDLKLMVKAALAWLQHHQSAINALNVYPVPDGDTGTNMVLTMQSAWNEIDDSPEQNIGHIAQQMSHGALMGARGNSGVILSQVCRGLARSLDHKEICHAQDLADAFREASVTAYKGVVKPVEGTILTVARAVADSAVQAVEESDDIVRLLEHMVFAAHETVLITPSMLPVLKEAGVVDAGGQGLFVILEGMLRHLRGEPIAEDMELGEGVDLTSSMEPGEIGYGYDVQFLIVGQQLSVEGVRKQVTEMGESALVVGDPSTVKVHVHVPDPGVPISYGASLGSLRDVVIEDMQAQYQDFIAHQELAESAAPAPHEIGVVAVTAGDGLALVFQSLGAHSVVRGGQTMNPSTKDLLEAIEDLPAQQVIILPNNSNVILAAEQARKLSEKPVAVIPTKTVPQGVCALLALNPQADIEDNVSSMTQALTEVETGEVTRATRSTKFNGVKVKKGQLIGLHNGDLKIAGETIEEVVRDLLREMSADYHEIITLYYGEETQESEAEAMAQILAEEWPEQEVEVVNGGQPHYHYILSVE